MNQDKRIPCGGTRHIMAFKRVLKWLTASIITVFLILVLGFVYLSSKIVPPLSGQVVDAITGKPIESIEVALHATKYEGFAIVSLRYENKVSTQDGYFDFARSSYWDPPPLSYFREYWLTVNEEKSYSSVPFAASTSPDGRRTADDVLENPTLDAADRYVSNNSYFPVTLSFRMGGCAQIWNATCISVNPWKQILVPLIPVVKNLGDCKLIHDPVLQERCRQLNTYRSAFLHLDTPEELEKDRQLCAEVDHSAVSGFCGMELSEWLRRKAERSRSVFPIADAELKNIFPASIGEASLIQASIWDNNTVSHHIGYAANYGRQGHWPIIASVVIENFSDPVRAKEVLFGLSEQDAGAYHLASVVEETRLGQKIRMYRSSEYTSAQWTNGSKLIRIAFPPSFQEQDQFISKYLEKIPSTLLSHSITACHRLSS